MMTAGELRALLDGVHDDAPVMMNAAGPRWRIITHLDEVVVTSRRMDEPPVVSLRGDTERGGQR